MRTVVPVLRGGHLPLRAARLFLLCVSLEVFATPTGHYHGRMLIHPSSPACATPLHKGVCTHASSGPSRVRRRLLLACLGDPIPLAPTATPSSGMSGSRCFSLILLHEKIGDVFDGVIFPRLLISWRKLQVSPFTHCPLVSHCQQSPRILCTRCFVP